MKLKAIIFLCMVLSGGNVFASKNKVVITQQKSPLAVPKIDNFDTLHTTLEKSMNLPTLVYAGLSFGNGMMFAALSMGAPSYIAPVIPVATTIGAGLLYSYTQKK